MEGKKSHTHHFTSEVIQSMRAAAVQVHTLQIHEHLQSEVSVSGLLSKMFSVLLKVGAN